MRAEGDRAVVLERESRDTAVAIPPGPKGDASTTIEDSSVTVDRRSAVGAGESADLAVEWIRTPDEFRQLAAVWNPLLQASQSETVFLTWSWMESWVKCFLTDKRALFVLCVRAQGELIGIAPWYVEKVRRGLVTLREIRFLGGPESGPDYLDVILREGKERVVVEALYRFLFGEARRDWDELRLTDVPAESLFLLHFLNVVNERGKFSELQRHAYLPQTPLPANADEFFAALSSNRRYIFNRDMRRLAKEGPFEHLTFRGNSAHAGLTRFFDLYDAKSGYDDGPRLVAFLRMLCDRDDAREWVELDVLTVGGRDIAGLLHLRYGANLAMLKMVVDKTFSRRISAGNLLVGMAIRRGISTGADCYDFLKGDEDYKFHWARRGRVTLSLTLPQRHWNALIVTIYRLAKYAAKVVLR